MAIQDFDFIDEATEDGVSVRVDDSEATFILNQQGIITQLIPPSALGLFADTQLLGHDKAWNVAVTQADGITPFPLAGLPITFYAKQFPASTTINFSKTLALNPTDIQVNTGTGIITVWIRAVNIAVFSLGSTLFLYIDTTNAQGGAVNIAQWTVTLTS